MKQTYKLGLFFIIKKKEPKDKHPIPINFKVEKAHVMLFYKTPTTLLHQPAPAQN
jgi:hypothetical protein